MAPSQLPKLPALHQDLVNYIAANPNTPMTELLDPYKEYEAQLRGVYAQDRSNPILDDPYLNVLPLFTQDTPKIQTRARNLANETAEEKEKYVMALPDEKRRPNGSPAIVASLKEFRHNFNIFSESALSEINWDDIVAAGFSVVNCLLPVPGEYMKSKRALREYYHEKFCPASDAIEKTKEIETAVRDAILSEVTVVRTKNAITICSQYPTRHVQVVLRVYKSVSEILTGFDIDCAGAAYDGKQINPIDLSRRSPSYESRLSKYSHRNFEVHWPELERSRIDPTIFERSFKRTLGLARLLVLERLPTPNARDQYLRKRREERGRPQLPQHYQHRLFRNIKDTHADEIADWIDEEDVSNYHTFTIPYGEKFHAKKIEKLCYTRDLLLNAEWNQPKERDVYLHRHPAFFGRVEDVIGDCCGTCPQPKTPEEIEISEKEREIHVSGKLSFRIEDPGRQQIGSFNPLTEDDWTEMAYVGNTAQICQAIVDCDIEHVQDWLAQEGADPNTRDYTGRTLLHLAVISSTPAIVKCLVDSGARLAARIADGRTALHLAASRGDIEMIKILLEKSLANEKEENDKQDRRRKARQYGVKSTDPQNAADTDESDDESNTGDESDDELIEDAFSEDKGQSMATGSFVKVKKNKDAQDKAEDIPLDDDKNEPDFYKIDMIAWDSHCSPLHLAIIGGHCEVVKLLCQEFGADVLLPVKLGDGSAPEAILTLVLALALPVEKAIEMSETLRSLGATFNVTAFHRYIKNGSMKLIDSIWENDKLALKTAINHVALSNWWNNNATTPLMTAIDQGNPILVLKLLEAGAKPEIDFDTWLQSMKTFESNLRNFESNKIKFQDSTEQPLIVAVRSPRPLTAVELLERGVNPNTMEKSSHNVLRNEYARRWQVGRTALDIVRAAKAKLVTYQKSYTKSNLPLVDRSPKFPTEPRGAADFLSQFTEGTYQHWLVSADIADRQQAHKEVCKEIEEEEKKLSSEGLVAKKEAIEELISQFSRVEKALLAKDAKTFQELHPSIDARKDPQPEPQSQRSEYKLEFTFRNITDLTDSRKLAYIQLFEAAWTGDLEKIKSLTLAPWGENKNEPPLKISASDMKGNNVFSIAFLKGHLDAAKSILDITHAQWSPREEQKGVFRMTQRSVDEDSDCSDSDSNSEPEICKEIINDQFTIDNIGQVSMQVNSHVLPSTLLSMYTPTFVHRGEHIEKTDFAQKSLFTFAIYENDRQRFDFLLDMHIRCANNKPDVHDDGDSSKFFQLQQAEFLQAMNLGRIHLLGEAIRRSGAGIGLEDLVKKSGTPAMKVKPRYYQGLTVYGKKRSDWARAGRNLAIRPKSSVFPPLLWAASSGSLESVEWFLSDTPLRHYLEFGKSEVAKKDPRLKHLNESPGGFDRAIKKWMAIQNDLVLHCVVLGPLQGATNGLLTYLIKTCPSSLETKSDQGYTPLNLACLMGRVEFAKGFVNAGANQSILDPNSNNLIHACLTNRPKVKPLREMLELFEPELRSHMFRQRNKLAAGGDTPVHSWLKSFNPVQTRYHHSYGRSGNFSAEDPVNIDILRLILEFSEGQELEAFNRSGDTVVHTSVMRHLSRHTEIFLGNNPELLRRENTVGRTPAEIAYDTFVASEVESPDPIEVGSQDRHLNDNMKKDPKSFLLDAEPTKSSKEAMWEVVQKYLAKAKGERRLVSLSECNDVAKRLGEAYSPQRYFYATRTTEARDDEPAIEEEVKVDFVNMRYVSEKSKAWKLETQQ
ncbi:ankyrin repeat protein [Xylariaceae sp. FL0255]|nr:ankyrin repeat protein [Xylariaceae sp. FL0255]